MVKIILQSHSYTGSELLLPVNSLDLVLLIFETRSCC